MPTVSLRLTAEEFSKLNKQKGKASWRDFFMDKEVAQIQYRGLTIEQREEVAEMIRKAIEEASG